MGGCTPRSISKDRSVARERRVSPGLPTTCLAALLGLALLCPLAAGAQSAAGVETAHVIPLLPSAGDVREGFARIINHSERPGTVRIRGTDEAGRRYLTSLRMDARESVHLGSRDLENGNPAKGLLWGLGPAKGNWRLEFVTDLDIKVGAYVRTPDGFLAPVHDVVRTVDIDGETVHRVPVFNSGSDRSRVSWLGVSNLTDARVGVTIRGRDDEGEPAPGGEVRLTIPARATRRLSAQQLESGGAGLAGRLGDGDGRWQLSVIADGEVDVVSLLQGPGGHLANLSMSPRVASSTNGTDGAAGSPAWVARHDLSSSQLEDAAATYTRQGYRPVAVSGYTVGGAARFAAIWSKVAGPAWVARHDLSSSQLEAATATYTRQGYRPVAVSGYTVGGAARFAAIWHKEAVAPAWVAHHNLSSADFQDAFDTFVPQGYRPVAVSGYTVGGAARFAAIGNKMAGPAWVARYNMSSSQYQTRFATYTRQGYRPVAVSGYTVGGAARFAAIWSKVAGPAWMARHNMSSSQYQSAIATYTRQGYQPVAVSGYTVGDAARFAAIWSKTGEPARTVRRTVRQTLPLFLPAGSVRQGLARIINHSGESGTVRITGIDDAGARHGPVTLGLGPYETAHFNSRVLETGSASKGFSGRLGNGSGNWRLELETELDIEPLAYVRTGDGFLTPMNAVARTVEVGGDSVHRVPIFNPASDRREVSRLRVINRGAVSATVTVAGRDDAGNPGPSGEVRFTLAGGAARTISAWDLEAGGRGLHGRLGDGEGKWQLSVTATGAIQVMSLAQSPADHLSNLSTAARSGFEIVSGGPATVRPLQSIHLKVPGGLEDSDYTVVLDLSGTGRFPSDDTFEVEGLTTEDDRILFASPLTRLLPEANASHRLAVRVRRDADGATSNVLRYSIDDITSVAGPPGFPSMVLEIILKSMYASVDDPLLNLEAASMQPGLVTWSAARLGVDSTFSDVLAESVMQSLFGFPVTELAPGPVVPAPASGPGSAHTRQVLATSADIRVATAASGSLLCDLTGNPAASAACTTIHESSDYVERRNEQAKRLCGPQDWMDECFIKEKKHRAETIDGTVQKYFSGLVDGLKKSLTQRASGAAVGKLASAGKGMLIRNLPKNKAGTTLEKMQIITTVKKYAEAGTKLHRVFKADRGDDAPGRSDSGRDLEASGQMTKRGLRRNFESLKGIAQIGAQELNELLPRAEREFAADPNPDHGARESFSVVVNDVDRQLREAEALDDLEDVYREEQDPGKVIGNNPDRGVAVGADCEPGYREFPLEDGKTSTCVFESLVEENCYRGSRQPSEVDLGGSDACLYYSLDFFQPNGSCLPNYKRVQYQERWTCRWAELGPDQPPWYTLREAEEKKGEEEPGRLPRSREEIREFCRDGTFSHGFTFTPESKQYCTYCGYTPSCDLEAWKAGCERDDRPLGAVLTCPPVAEAGPPRAKDTSLDRTFRVPPGGGATVVLTDYIEDLDGGRLSFSVHSVFGWTLEINGGVLSISRTSEYDVSAGLVVTATDDEGYSEEFQFWLAAETYSDPGHDKGMSRTDAERSCSGMRSFSDTDYQNCIACGVSATCDLLEWLPRCDVLSGTPPYCPATSSTQPSGRY